jgi:hypothetical protein
VFRRPVESSLIRSVGYDLASSILEVEFAGENRVYQYFDVPLSIYSELMAAESKGNYFNDHVKDMYPYEEVEVVDSRYPAARDADHILRFILDRIAHIGKRPLMYGGNAAGVDLILACYLELWAEIVGLRDDYEAAAAKALAEAGAGSATFASHYRQGRPDAPEDEVASYVVQKWMAIAARCGLDVPPAIDETAQERSSPNRETP